MFTNRKIVIVVLHDVNDEALLETTLLIDLIHGSNRVLMKKIGSNGLNLTDVSEEYLLIFWISEFTHEVELVLRKGARSNPCMVIYDSNSRLSVRQIIQTNIRGILSSNSVSELPNALKVLNSNAYFIRQESLKSILGNISGARTNKILSRRELEVLNLLSHGLTYLEISAKLHISYDTTKTHTNNIYRKLGARNKAEAVNKARGWMILS